MTRVRPAETSTLARTPISARTRVVWASFAGAMTLVTGALFVLGGNDVGPMTGRTITPLVDINTPNSMESIFSPDVEIEEGRWNAIVIHHTG